MRRTSGRAHVLRSCVVLACCAAWLASVESAHAQAVVAPDAAAPAAPAGIPAAPSDPANPPPTAAPSAPVVESGAGVAPAPALTPGPAAGAPAAGAPAAAPPASAIDVAVELPAPTPASEQPPPAHAIDGDPFGDVGGGISAGMFSLRALLQARYTATFAPESTNMRASYAVREDFLAQKGDGYSINRLFLRVGADPTPYLGFKMIVDFAELIDDDPDEAIKQAYATLRAIPERLEFTAGVFKLPYSTLELDPSARFELADFGQADTLVKDLGFAGRDIGVQVNVAPLSKPKYLQISAGTFRGHSHGENDSPFGAVGARVETKPVKALRFGVDFVAQPQTVIYQRPFETSGKELLPHPPDPMYPYSQQWNKGWAWSADARYQRKRLMVRAEVMAGDRVDEFTLYGAKTFAAVWGIAAYRFRIGPLELMPALRAEWLDANRQQPVGLRRQLTAAVTLLYQNRVRLLFDVTRTDVQAQSPLLDQPEPLSDPAYMELDNTRFITQLQLEI